MANILFVSNNKAHFVNGQTSSDSATFDANRVPYSLLLQHQAAMSTPQFTPATGDITWCHFRFFFDTLYNQDTTHLIRGYDVDGNTLFSVDKYFNTTEYITILKLYKASGTSVDTQAFPFNESLMNNVDIRYEATGSLTKVSMYVNGGLAADLEDANPVTTGQVASISIQAVFAQVAGGEMMISEIIVADGDTRNARLDLLRPVASGGETDWVGLAASLADDDPSSGMTSIAAEERQTLTLSTYNGADNISALVIATQSMAGANGPQNLKHTVRMATVNYDGTPTFPLGDTLEFNVTDFKINPATSLPWVGGDLTSMEMGFISKT